MTNKEKFIEIMNETFNFGLTIDNVITEHCPPNGRYRLGACDSTTCVECSEWWNKEWKRKDER